MKKKEIVLKDRIDTFISMLYYQLSEAVNYAYIILRSCGSNIIIYVFWGSLPNLFEISSFLIIVLLDVSKLKFIKLLE